MAKLGTTEKPAIVRVQTEDRAREILALCQSHQWQVVAGIEPDRPEDIKDVEKLMNQPLPAGPSLNPTRTVSGNDYCPCGSGLKFKKCCGLKHGPGK